MRALAKSLGITLIALGMSAPALGGQVLSIPGTEAFHPLLVQLAASYNASHTDLQIHVPEPVGSRGGIKAVVGGKASLAATSRPLKKREMSKNLVYRPFAMSQIVFVVNPSVRGIERLTKDQVLAIYSGTIKNWQEVGGPNNKIYPITRDAGSTLKALIKSFPEFGKLEKKVAKQTFNSQESVDLAVKYDYTIAYAPLGLVTRTNLRIVEVEGVSSSATSLWDGSARVPVIYGLVHDADPPEEVLKFLRFLATPVAHAIMQQHGARPIDVAGTDTIIQ